MDEPVFALTNMAAGYFWPAKFVKIEVKGNYHE
jgi:hypothetical protein